MGQSKWCAGQADSNRVTMPQCFDVLIGCIHQMIGRPGSQLDRQLGST